MNKTKRLLQIMPVAVLVTGGPIATVTGTEALRDKTLVAWVSPANLTQRGGSVPTIEKPGGVFDKVACFLPVIRGN